MVLFSSGPDSWNCLSPATSVTLELLLASFLSRASLSNFFLVNLGSNNWSFLPSSVEDVYSFKISRMFPRQSYCCFSYEKSLLLMSKYNLLRIIKDNHCVVLTTSVGGKESSTNIISFLLINFLLLILSTNEI